MNISFEKSREIVMDAIDNPNAAGSLLVSQLATNPRGFKFSEKAINSIEAQSNPLNKMIKAVKLAASEGVLKV